MCVPTAIQDDNSFVLIVVRLIRSFFFFFIDNLRDCHSKYSLVRSKKKMRYLKRFYTVFLYDFAVKDEVF